MLTKQDLNAIKGIVQTEVHSGLEPVRKDIGKLQKDVVKLQGDVTKLRKDLTTTINFFDKSDQDIKSKLNKTRGDVGLENIEFAY